MLNVFWGKHIRKEVGCSHPELAVWVNCRRDHSKGPRETIWLLSANSAVIVLQLPLHEGIRKWSWEHLSLYHFFCSLPTFPDFGGRVIHWLKRGASHENKACSHHTSANGQHISGKGEKASEKERDVLNMLSGFGRDRPNF